VGVSCESARGVRRLVRAFGRAARALRARDCRGVGGAHPSHNRAWRAPALARNVPSSA
jgi:hypothetical protein